MGGGVVSGRRVGHFEKIGNSWYAGNLWYVRSRVYDLRLGASRNVYCVTWGIHEASIATTLGCGCYETFISGQLPTLFQYTGNLANLV